MLGMRLHLARVASETPSHSATCLGQSHVVGCGGVLLLSMVPLYMTVAEVVPAIDRALLVLGEHAKLAP